MFKSHFFLALSVSLLLSAHALSQNSDDGTSQQSTHNNIGVVGSYFNGYDIGIRIKASKTFIIRSTFNFLHSINQEQYSEFSWLQSGIGLELLFPKEIDLKSNLFNTYFGWGLRFNYNEDKNKPQSVSDYRFINIKRTLGINGFTGLEYWLNDRFSFFGEIGLTIGDSPSFDGSNFYFNTTAKFGLNFMF